MKKDEETVLSKKIEVLLDEGNAAIADARSYLISQGELVDLSEWITIKEYCHRFGISNAEIVLDWISNGVVPKDNVMTVEEFNSIKLIKAVPYAVRQARVS